MYDNNVKGMIIYMDGVLLNLSDEYCRGIFPSYVCDIINKSETLMRVLHTECYIVRHQLLIQYFL